MLVIAVRRVLYQRLSQEAHAAHLSWTGSASSSFMVILEYFTFFADIC